MQQLVILLLINCSSTCFERLYAHHQEVRLRFTDYCFLSCCSRCDVGESGCKLCALCGIGCLIQATVKQPIWLKQQSSSLFHTVHTACISTLQHHNSYNRTENHKQWNAVWPPDDGRKDARNMLRNNWITIKSLIVASSLSRLYLLEKWFLTEMRYDVHNCGCLCLAGVTTASCSPLYLTFYQLFLYVIVAAGKLYKNTL
jgi:hypothetical protein